MACSEYRSEPSYQTSFNLQGCSVSANDSLGGQEEGFNAIDSVSSHVSQHKRILATEEQYCKTYEKLLNKNEVEKQNLEKEIETIQFCISSCQRRHETDVTTRQRMQESVLLWREKVKRQEETKRANEDSRKVLMQKVTAARERHHTIFQRIKSKYPNALSKDREDTLNILLVLRREEQECEARITSLTENQATIEPQEWRLWQDFVIKLAEVMTIRVKESPLTISNSIAHYFNQNANILPSVGQRKSSNEIRWQLESTSQGSSKGAEQVKKHAVNQMRDSSVSRVDVIQQDSFRALSVSSEERYPSSMPPRGTNFKFKLQSLTLPKLTVPSFQNMRDKLLGQPSVTRQPHSQPLKQTFTLKTIKQHELLKPQTSKTISDSTLQNIIQRDRNLPDKSPSSPGFRSSPLVTTKDNAEGQREGGKRKDLNHIDKTREKISEELLNLAKSPLFFGSSGSATSTSEGTDRNQAGEKTSASLFSSSKVFHSTITESSINPPSSSHMENTFQLNSSSYVGVNPVQSSETNNLINLEKSLDQSTLNESAFDKTHQLDNTTKSKSKDGEFSSKFSRRDPLTWDNSSNNKAMDVETFSQESNTSTILTLPDNLEKTSSLHSTNKKNISNPIEEQAFESSSPEISYKIPSTLERKAYVQSLLSSPEFSYSPIKKTKLSSFKEPSEVRSQLEKTDPIQEGKCNNVSKPAKMNQVEEDHSKDEPMQLAEFNESPPTNVPSTEDFMNLRQEPERQDDAGRNNISFSFDLFSQPRNDFSSLRDNALSLFGSPTQEDSTNNFQTSGANFSLFGNEEPEFAPQNPNSGFSFNFGASNKGETRQESSFFSLFSPSSPSAKENASSSSQPTFKLF